MEDYRSYKIDSEEIILERDEVVEREMAAEDELPFEIPRD